MSTSEARLMIAASETDADMYYATRFLAPDPFIFFQIGAKKHLLMSDLERDRARDQAQVDRVLSLSEYQKKAKKKRHRRRTLSNRCPARSPTGKKHHPPERPPRLCHSHGRRPARTRLHSGISRRRVLARPGNQNP